MSEADWDALEILTDILGGSNASMVRTALYEMAKSRHVPTIMGDNALMWSPMPRRGRKVFTDRHYGEQRLQVPLTPDDKKFLEKLKIKTGISKAGLLRESIHWYMHTHKYRIDQARKLFNLKKQVA
jgi:hypothetical protein